MNHTYRVLKSDIELFAAALNQARVYVVQPLREDAVAVVDCGGSIESFRLIRSRLLDLVTYGTNLNLE